MDVQLLRCRLDVCVVHVAVAASLQQCAAVDSARAKCRGEQGFPQFSGVVRA